MRLLLLLPITLPLRYLILTCIFSVVPKENVSCCVSGSRNTHSILSYVTTDGYNFVILPTQNSILSIVVKSKLYPSLFNENLNLTTLSYFWSKIKSALDGKASSTHTHSAATTSANGFMSSADKTKLDGVATGANNYSHPSSGVTASTYKSVTVNAQGHVTAGSNPTTLSGYGITDAASSNHTHNYAGSSSAGGAATTSLTCTGNSATATKLATARTINGVSFDGSSNITVADDTKLPLSGGTITGTLNVSNPTLGIKSGSTTGNSEMNENPLYMSTLPFSKYGWKDLFAFCKVGVPTYETSTDGSTWVSSDANKGLFIQRDSVNINIISASNLACRFTWINSGFCWSRLSAILVFYGYNSISSSKQIQIEVGNSSTGIYSIVHTSITVGQERLCMYPITPIANSSYNSIRLTITKTTNIDTGIVYATNIRGVSCFNANGTGLGTNLEYPYDCDDVPNILPINDNTSALGSSSKKWANIYATTLTGSLSGNASTATALTTSAGSDKQPVYFSNGKPVVGTYTLGNSCEKSYTDSSSASAIGTGTSLPTERDIYYGLPTINANHTYTSSTTLFCPTVVGSSGQILKSNGSGAPSWINQSDLTIDGGTF